MKTEPGDLTGRVIASQFRVERKLGQGGMGAVYLAEQLEMGRQVVLKVMRPSLLGSAAAPVIEERFKREARIVAQLNHPNIVQVHVFGRTDDDQLYLAMEYIEGRSLRELLSMRGALPEARALRIMDQLCSALVEAHDLGLVHRDLKPDNVMLTDRHGNPDYVKVLDFGIAKMRTAPDARLTQTGAVFGTPAYISPEQARALPVDRRTDIYALGVILYEMLSGQLPFVADNAFDYLLKHVSAPVELLSTRFPGIVILPCTEAMVARALEKEPENRFQSAAEMQREVRRALRDRPDAARPFPTPALPLDEETSVPAAPGRPAVRTAVLPIDSPAVGGTAVLPSTSERSAIRRTVSTPEAPAVSALAKSGSPKAFATLPAPPARAGAPPTSETHAEPEEPAAPRTPAPPVIASSAPSSRRRRLPLLLGSAVAVLAVGGYVAFKLRPPVERGTSSDGQEPLRPAPAPVFGTEPQQVEARCQDDQGAWEESDADSSLCRHARRNWSFSTDVRTWYTQGGAIAETSFGPVETFEQAAYHAKEVAAIKWGAPVTDTWAYDCGRQDPRQRADDARSRKCRWSWRWRAGQRQTHLLVAPRSANGWQVVLDDSQSLQVGKGQEGSYPNGVGQFRFGEETADDARACRASKGHFIGPKPSRSPGCEDAQVPDVEMTRARLVLHHECYDDALCRVHVSQDSSRDLDAVKQFRTSRKAMLAWLGPPDQDTSTCTGYALGHLVDSLRDGHCEVFMSWRKEEANITLGIRPTDPVVGGPVMYPVTHWTVTASFLTPEYEKTRRSVPPL